MPHGTCSITALNKVCSPRLPSSTALKSMQVLPCRMTHIPYDRQSVARMASTYLLPTSDLVRVMPMKRRIGTSASPGFSSGPPWRRSARRGQPSTCRLGLAYADTDGPGCSCTTAWTHSLRYTSRHQARWRGRSCTCSGAASWLRRSCRASWMLCRALLCFLCSRVDVSERSAAPPSRIQLLNNHHSSASRATRSRRRR
jgi:hypothetical protein